MNVRLYSKALVAVAAAGLFAAQAALGDGQMTAEEWVGVAFALVTATGVYLVPNGTDPDPDPDPPDWQAGRHELPDPGNPPAPGASFKDRGAIPPEPLT
ncbi:MAG: hypothetical protein ACRDRC_01690 [Pseudonocardiaceae bacterium]